MNESVSPYQFENQSLWSQQPGVVAPSSFAEMVNKNEDNTPATNFSQLMLAKPENAMSTPYWNHDSDSVPGSALQKQKRIKSEDDDGDKRRRTSSNGSSPDMDAVDAPKSSTPSREEAPRTIQRKPGGSRRPPPSASQITEAGQPFPVIDTSAKHSSLFVPPDTSGLTKREARLVKNRAAAFLSRQRKREQFEELGGKCKMMARLVWVLYESYTQAVAAGAPYERVENTTPLEMSLKQESDELQQTFEQIVQRQGSVVFEGIGDERAQQPAQQLRTEQHADQLAAELTALRAENKALRAKLEEPPRTLVLARHNMQSAFVAMLMVALNLARVPTPSPLMDLTAGNGVFNALLGDDDASNNVVRMNVSPATTNEPLLCSLMIESAADEDNESKRGRSASPEGVQPCDGSSEGSAPSLLSAQSASPAPSSLSSTCVSRRIRRVMAFSSDSDAIKIGVPSLAAFEASGLREHVSIDLNGWVNTHARSLSGDIAAATTSLRQCLADKVDLGSGFILMASAEDGIDDSLRLSLYGRSGAKVEPIQVDKVLSAAKEALFTLERGTGTHGVDAVSVSDNSMYHTQIACAETTRKRRDTGTFLLTYHP